MSPLLLKYFVDVFSKFGANFFILLLGSFGEYDFLTLKSNFILSFLISAFLYLVKKIFAAVKGKMRQMGLLQTKSFCTVKETNNTVKRQLTD